MSYEKLKKEMIQAMEEYYQGGTPLTDIRAAIHAADLAAEQCAALELLEILKQRAGKTET